MSYIRELSWALRLKRGRRRAVKAWNGKLPSVRRRKRRLKWILGAAAAGELFLAAGRGSMWGWVRRQWPAVRYIEERETAGALKADEGKH